VGILSFGGTGSGIANSFGPNAEALGDSTFQLFFQTDQAYAFWFESAGGATPGTLNASGAGDSFAQVELCVSGGGPCLVNATTTSGPLVLTQTGLLDAGETYFFRLQASGQTIGSANFNAFLELKPTQTPEPASLLLLGTSALALLATRRRKK
jgi:hypothetical protein